MKALLAVMLGVFVLACAPRSAPLPRLQSPAPAQATAAPASGSCASNESADRVAAAVMAMGARRVDVHNATPPFECALRARGIAARAARADRAEDVAPTDADLVVWLDVGPAFARQLAQTSFERSRIVTWVDDSAVGTPGILHFVAPEAGRFQHILLLPRLPSEQDVRILRRRLAAVRLWPYAPGVDVLRTYDDGLADVRVLGYLRTTAGGSDGRELVLDDVVTTPSVAYGWTTLTLPAPLRAELGTFLRSQRGSISGPSGELSSEERDATMASAVGTCGTPWITGAAVVLHGRGRIDDGGLHVDVDSAEQPISVTTWTALKPRYERALRASIAAVDRGNLARANDALASFHDDLRRAYGAATPLLELDVLLGRVENALQRRRTDDAALAFDETRCRPTDAEATLARTLRSAK